MKPVFAIEAGSGLSDLFHVLYDCNSGGKILCVETEHKTCSGSCVFLSKRQLEKAAMWRSGDYIWPANALFGHPVFKRKTLN